MSKLSKKQIIITVAIVLILAIIIGVALSGSDTKEGSKHDTKIEQQETEKTDNKDKEENAEEKESEAVETETETETETEEQTENNVVEEPKQQQTTQQQGSSNTNNSQNQNNNNSGGGTTTPSTPATTPTPTPEPEKSPYAGMYHRLDATSQERLAKCAEILKTGIGSQYIPVKCIPNTVEYWGEALSFCTDGTSGAWMYVNIAGWSGQGIGAETEPIFAEIPSLTKRCFEAIAPQGGTELFNKINSLILQYGNERNVPSQGTVSESIPGLSVTINDGVNGLEIFFWAE